MKHLLCLLLIAQSLTALSQFGNPDSSFGINGNVVDTRISGQQTDMVYQPDGKMIVSGYDNFILARYNSDGSPDITFGEDGIVRNNFPNTLCYALALQDDGKIVAAGRISLYEPDNFGADIFLVRYKTDGGIDSSFGNNGIATTSAQIYDNLSDVVIQPDGKMVVNGLGINEENEAPAIFAVRFNENGSIDQTFAENGKLIIVKNEGIVTVSSLALNRDGSILIGLDYSISGNASFAVLKLKKEGDIDTQFGINGEALYAFPNTDGSGLHDIEIQADGKIIATGYTSLKNTPKNNITTIRFNETGLIDDSFGKSGVVITEVGPDGSDGKAIKINAEGVIIIGGRLIKAYPSKNYYAILFAYKSNGTPDSSFAENGINIVTEAGDQSLYNNVIIQPDGKIAAAGDSYFLDVQNTYFILSRFNGENKNAQPKYVKIKRWLHRHGFTWEDRPNNVKYYSVQSSTNGSAFNEIARIVNRGNTTQHFEDASPASGISYYRVAAVSANNVSSYSNVIAIENNNAQIKVYPNPAKNVLQVAGLPATEKTKLSIADINGNTRMATVANSNLFSWNIGQLTKGNYVLHVQYGNTNISRKFIKE